MTILFFQVHSTSQRRFRHFRPDRVDLHPGLDAGEDQGGAEARGGAQLQHLLPDAVGTRSQDPARPQPREPQRSQLVYDPAAESEWLIYDALYPLF